MANKKVNREAVMSSLAQRAEEVTAAVKEAAKAVGDKAEEVIADASEALAEAAKDSEPKTAAPEKKEAEADKKEPAKAEKKPAEKKEKAARKPRTTKAAKPAKKEAAEPEIYVQFGASEAALAGVVDKIKAEYVEQGHRASSIKSLKVYLKPEDGAAYYVINDKLAGRVDLF